MYSQKKQIVLFLFFIIVGFGVILFGISLLNNLIVIEFLQVFFSEFYTIVSPEQFYFFIIFVGIVLIGFGVVSLLQLWQSSQVAMLSKSKEDKIN
ncbi:MAG: hypothetical protein ACFFDI_16895 [Promethearchaeota archaeon]